MSYKQAHFDSLNPYRVPQTEFKDDLYALSAYTGTGRIGRLRYLVYFLLLFVGALVLYGAAFILFVLNKNNVIFTSGSAGLKLYLEPLMAILLYVLGNLVMLSAVVIAVSFTVRRLYDISRSAWWALLLFVSFLNVVFWLYLLLVRGDKGENDRGMPPTPPSAVIKWLVLLLPLVAVLALLAFVYPKMYVDYIMVVIHNMERVLHYYD